MKNTIIALSLIFILAGCGGGSSSSSGSDSDAAREVSVALNVLEVKNITMSVDGIMYGTQESSFGYKHYLKTNGYKMCATDERATYCEYISLRDPDNINLVFTLYGDAVIKVDNPYMTGGQFQNYYTVSGSTSVSSSEDSVMLSLSNNKWAYITVDNHELISAQAPPFLSGNPNPYDDQQLALDQYENYFYQYVDPSKISPVLNVPLNSGDVLHADLSHVVPNKHYAYKVTHKAPDETHDPSVGVVIEDKWEEPKDICIGNQCETK